MVVGVEVGDGGVEMEGVEVGGMGVRESMASGLRMICSWSPPLSNTTLRDSINLHVGLCIRQKVVRCWEKPRKMHDRD